MPPDAVGRHSAAVEAAAKGADAPARRGLKENNGALL
jgi:hypothetical protein